MLGQFYIIAEKPPIGQNLTLVQWRYLCPQLHACDFKVDSDICGCTEEKIQLRLWSQSGVQSRASHSLAKIHILPQDNVSSSITLFLNSGMSKLPLDMCKQLRRKRLEHDHRQ